MPQTAVGFGHFAEICLALWLRSNILFPVGTMIGERLLYIPSAGLLLTVVSLIFSWRRGAFLLWIACSLGIWRCALRVPDFRFNTAMTVTDRDYLNLGKQEGQGVSCSFFFFVKLNVSYPSQLLRKYTNGVTAAVQGVEKFCQHHHGRWPNPTQFGTSAQG